MKVIILKELKQLLGRSEGKSNAVYYTLTTLSQFYIDSPQISEELLTIYLSIFQGAEDDANSILPILLSGISRALPYTKSKNCSENRNKLGYFEESHW